MPRSPRKPTTFFTTSSKPGTERSVCSAARSAGCSQVTGAIPVRILRGRSAGTPLGSLIRCSYYECRLSTTRGVAPCFASELAARPRPVNWRPHTALADDAEPRLQPRYRAGSPSSSRSRERLIEIGNQVFHVLDPHGEPHQTVAQPHLVAQRLWDARVRHRGGVPDQALHAAQRLGEREDPGALDEAPRPLQAPEFQADHAAEPLHLAARELVLRVRRQAGVVDPLHFGMMREPLGDAAAA